MVSTLSMICMIVTLLLSLVLPITAFVWYGRKHKQKGIWIAGVLGAGGFALLQLGIRLTILSMITTIPAVVKWIEGHYILYCFWLAFTAGIFEVIARYGVAKILYKNKSLVNNLTYEIGFMAGIGHGGIEAIALVGATYINNLIFAILVSTGLWTMVLDAISAAADAAGDSAMYEVYAPVQTTLIDTPWYLYLVGGYERLLTMIAHIAMTLVVFYFVGRKKDIIGILIALGWHTAIDFFVPLFNGMASEYLGNRITQNMAYACVYILLTVIALIAIVVIMKLKAKWKVLEEVSCQMINIS